MGRFYTGDIEGRFGFAVQSSTDGERFGAKPVEPNIITYYAEDIKECEEGIKECLKCLSIPNKYFNKVVNHFKDINNKYELFWDEIDWLKELMTEKVPEKIEEYNLHSLELGLKIYHCIKKQGDCQYDAEC